MDAALIPGGTYIISAISDSSKVVDLEASKEKGNLVIFKRHDGDNQRWIVDVVGNGNYTFRSAVRDFETYINAPDLNEGRQLRGSTEDPRKNEASQWKVFFAGEGKFVIQNVRYTDAINAEDGSLQNLSPIVHLPVLQRWNLEKL